MLASEVLNQYCVAGSVLGFQKILVNGTDSRAAFFFPFLSQDQLYWSLGASPTLRLF